LAHNIKTKKNIGKFLSHFSNDEELLFCFGEIDCRAQVHRFIDANTNYQTVINNTLENYISYIKSINNKNIILFGITPELKENPHQYYYRDHPEVFDCPKGALAERSSYKDFFNKRLKEISLENNWKFISIYDHIKNQNKIDDVYYLDDIHLKGNYVHYLIEYEFLKMGFSNMILSS
jgi:phage anti-repressor protein